GFPNTLEKHFIIRMKCFFLFIRNRISCFQKKMVQYPVEWNFTSNETEPAADGGLYICRK
ncbi:hypothetical protein CN476_25285, partial [Bacillus cereus]